MVIDTSAIIAILNLEPEATILADAIASDSVRLMSMGTALELSIIVKARKEEAGIRELDFFLYKAAINLVNFDENQLKIARYAFENYGKGRNPASLNFGDCFAYALSKTSGQPLLFKGNDFNQTDVSVAVEF
ncbi:MAG: type II toxin-antitoxin system VapC family toxin [Pleurocapsa sp.]